MILKKNNLKVMDQKNEPNIQTSSQLFENSNKNINNTGICGYETYFCAKDHIIFEELGKNVKKEYISFFEFLEKTKTFTINLYSEFVNFFDKGNGIFCISHCYSIKEINQCDIISPYFNSFLKLINLQIKNCIHIKNLNDFNQYVNIFYSNYECFLKKIQLFIGTKDLKELDMTIKKTKESTSKHFNNLNYQVEKKFLEYAEIMDIIISSMVTNSNLNPKEQGRLIIKNAKDDGWKILASKVKDRKAKEAVVTRVRRRTKNKKYSKRNIKGNDSKIKNNKDSVDNKGNLFNDSKDNIDEVKREELEYTIETAKLFKKIALSENMTNKTGCCVQNYTEDKFFISNSAAKINLEGISEGSNSIPLFFFIILGLVVSFGFVGITTAICCYFGKRIEERNKQNNWELSKSFEPLNT